MSLHQSAMLIWLIIGLVVVLYFGKLFLLPIALGALLAVLFNPLANRLERARFPNWLASTVCLLLLLLLLGGLSATVALQANTLAESWPEVEEKLSTRWQQAEGWLSQMLGLSKGRLEALGKQAAKQSQSLRQMAGKFLGSFFSSTTSALLTLVYLFLLLLARERIRRFLETIWPGDQASGEDMLAKSQRLVFKYLGGRLIIVGLLAVLYAIGFLIFGLPNAIPLAILAGVLSIIPYVGNVIGGLIAVAFGFALGDGLTVVLGVIGTMVLAQVLENNVFQPWIIGSQVSMNPLFTFMSILAFGLIWGVAGTIIAVPVAGVLREIWAQSPKLKPVAEVMGLGE